MDRRIFLIGGVSLVAGCALSRGKTRLAPNSVLYITRHADRDGENLNSKGRERAQALVAALEGLPLDAIYSPGIQRNLDTAAPIAAARGLEIATRPAEDPARRLVRDGAGGAALWVGNKGNLKSIWESFELPEPVGLEYGDLTILRTDASGTLTVERVRYGPQ